MRKNSFYELATIPEAVARLPKHYRPEHLTGSPVGEGEDEIRQRYLAMQEEHFADITLLKAA